MKQQRGFALASGIFLLVIIALLGAFMVSFSTTGNVDSANDLQGSRGYRAARMGSEWVVASICNGGSPCASPLTACPTIPSSLDTTPDGFTVKVGCTVNSYSEGVATRYVFWITSTATTGGSPGNLGYIERSINAFVEFPS
jgi:MSHA biogenesis protein MshP